MPLPEGFVLDQDQTPDKVSTGKPPEGFVLDHKLPPGFVLDSPVQSSNKTPTIPRTPFPQMELENPWIAENIGKLSDPAHAAWERMKQGISWPVEKFTQGVNFVGNLPSEISNKLRGQAPGMLGYVEPAFGEKATGPNLKILPELEEPVPGQKIPGHFEQSDTVGAGFNPLLGMPVMGTAPESRYVPEHEEELTALGGAYQKTAKMINALISRQNALAVPFGGSKAALTAFLAPVVAELPEKVKTGYQAVMDENATSAEKGGAIAEPLVDALMLFGGKKGLETPTPYSKPAEAGTRQPVPNVKGAEGKPFSMLDRLNTGINPDEMAKILVPAVKIGGRLVMGKQGDSHDAIIEREGGDPKLIPHEDPNRVFANPETGEMYDRKQAEQVTGIKGNAKAGGLDSQQLPGAQTVTTPTYQLRNRAGLIRNILKRQGYEIANEDITSPEGVMTSLRHWANNEIENTPPEHLALFKKLREAEISIRESEKQGEVKKSGKLYSGIPLPELLDDIELWKDLRGEFSGAHKRVRDNSEDSIALKDRDAALTKMSRLEQKYGGKTPIQAYRDERGLTHDSSLYSGIDLKNLFPGKKTDFDYKQVLSFVGARKGETAPEWLKSAKVTREAKYEGYAAGKGVYQQLKQQSDPYFDPQSNWFRHHPDQPGVVFHKQTGKPYFAMIKPELKGESLFVDGKPATAEQIAEIKKFQKEKEAGGTDFRVFDMDQAEVEKGGKIKEFKTEDGRSFGGQVYANPFAAAFWSKAVDKNMSYGVDRSLKEVFDTAVAKHSGQAAPFHITADKSHDTVNALVHVATSDIHALAKADEVGAKPGAFTTLFRKNAELELYNSYIKNGLGIPSKKGVKQPTIKGAPAIPVRLAGKSLWLRADLHPEFERAMKKDGPMKKAGLAAMMDYVTHVQIFGLTDAIYHTANMYGSIAGLPAVSSSMGYNLARTAVPLARQLDTAARLTKGFYDAILKTPATKAELSRLAEIGALRAKEKYGWGMGHVIKVLDQAGRLARNRIFDELVKAKIYKDTEFSRREFVNKMGQYNDRLMTKYEGFFKQVTSQFIVAGKTFNRNALNRVFLRPEAETVNTAAYWKYKLLAAHSTYVGLLTTTLLANYYLTGSPWGRKEKHIPVGMIDTGKDDEKTGQPIMIDPMQTTLDRRGVRGLGLQALARGIKEGDKMEDTIGHMTRDIAEFVAHPYEGPPVRLLEEIYLQSKGKKPFDYGAVASQINPHIGAAVKAKEQDKSIFRTSGEQIGSAVGLKLGQRPSRAEQVQLMTGKQEGKATLDDRLTAERKYTESRGPLTSKQKLAGQERALQNIEETRKDIAEQMPKDSQKWAEGKALSFPGVDRHIQYKDGKVTLTKQEITRYEQLVVAEYSKALPSIQKTYDRIPSPRAQKAYFSESLSAAKLRARQKLIEEIKSGSINEQDKKKKRFSVFSPEE